MESAPEPVPRPDFARIPQSALLFDNDISLILLQYWSIQLHITDTQERRDGHRVTRASYSTAALYTVSFSRACVATALLFVQRTVGPPQVEAQLSWVKLYGRRVVRVRQTKVVSCSICSTPPLQSFCGSANAS
jgi:hypothetical protein